MIKAQSVAKTYSSSMTHNRGSLKYMYLIYSNNVGKEGEELDLNSDKVHIDFFVEVGRLPVERERSHKGSLHLINEKVSKSKE